MGVAGGSLKNIFYMDLTIDISYAQTYPQTHFQLTMKNGLSGRFFPLKTMFLRNKADYPPNYPHYPQFSEKIIPSFRKTVNLLVRKLSFFFH
ncbi:hypothetical protein YSY43_35740 [Paenibacillus sp. YSY-4.3]